jgi:putative transcription factor
MQHQDWKPVVWTNPSLDQNALTESKKALHLIKKDGKVEIQTRIRPADAIQSQRSRKLDNNDSLETYRHQSISHDFKIALQQARVAKKITQQQLAQLIQVSETTIKNYESGKGIPDPKLIDKLNRVLNTKLPKNENSKPKE